MIEKEYNISIPEGSLRLDQTVADAVSFLDEKIR
jgi:acyl carrier protein